MEPVSVAPDVPSAVIEEPALVGFVGQRVSPSRFRVPDFKVPRWTGWAVGIAASFLAGFLTNELFGSDLHQDRPVTAALIEKVPPGAAFADAVLSTTALGTSGFDEPLSVQTASPATSVLLYRTSGAGIRMVDIEDGKLKTDRQLDRFGSAQSTRLSIWPGGGRYLAAHMDGRIVLERINAASNALWRVDWPVDSKAPASPLATKNGVAIAGPGREANKVMVAMLSEDGETQWQREFSGAPDRRTFVNRSVGDSVLLGVTETDAVDDLSVMVRHLDQSGEVQWRYALNLPSGAALAGVASDGEGGAFVATAGIENWLVHIDKNGSLDWIKPLPIAAQGNVLAIASTTAGDVIVSASVSAPSLGGDVWVGRFDTAGSLLAEAAPGFTVNHAATALSINPKGIPIIAGSLVDTAHSSTDMFIARLNLQSIGDEPPFAGRPEVQRTVSTEASTESESLVGSSSIEQPVEIEIAELELDAAAPPADNAGTDLSAVADLPSSIASPEPSGEREVTPASVLEPSAQTAPEGVQPAVSEPRADLVFQYVCTFKCTASGAPSVTYPMTQPFSSETAGTVAEISAVARGEHNRICRASGGVPTLGQAPTCAPS